MTALFTFNKQQNMFIEDKNGKPLLIDSINAMGEKIINAVKGFPSELTFSLICYKESNGAPDLFRLKIVSNGRNLTYELDFSIGQYYLQWTDVGFRTSLSTIIHEKFYKEQENV